MSLIQARVGLQRIQKFMEREEMSHSAPGYTNVPDPAASGLGTGLLVGASLGAGGGGGGGSGGLGGGVAGGGRPGSVSGLGLAVPLSIRDGTFCWEAGQEAAAVLQDINLEVRRGQLVMIVGQVREGRGAGGVGCRGWFGWAVVWASLVSLLGAPVFASAAAPARFTDAGGALASRANAHLWTSPEPACAPLCAHLLPCHAAKSAPCPRLLPHLPPCLPTYPTPPNPIPPKWPAA